MRQLRHSDWLHREIEKITPISEEWISKAKKRLNSLVKPKGSLGRLEEIAERIVAIREEERPSINKRAIFVFASDHGVVEEGVSAYPQDVTKGMVKNFLKGVAGINALAREEGADVYVVDIGVNGKIDEQSPYFLDRKIRNGTENILKGPAMSREEAEEAICVGMEIADMAKENGIDMIAGGDMGIGNTTASSAIFCAILGLDPEDIVGRGTGIDDERLRKKKEIVKRVLERNREAIKRGDPIEILSLMGGLEIAGICGLFLGGAKNRFVVLADGFISCAGALLAMEIKPEVKDYIFFSHCSAERGHRLFFEKIKERPLLDLDMRLGEGTGAAIAMHIIDCAIRVYNEMATFEEVGIKAGHEI